MFRRPIASDDARRLIDLAVRVDPGEALIEASSLVNGEMPRRPKSPLRPRACTALARFVEVLAMSEKASIDAMPPAFKPNRWRAFFEHPIVSATIATVLGNWISAGTSYMVGAWVPSDHVSTPIKKTDSGGKVLSWG